MWIVKKKIENKQKLFKQKYKAKARTDSNTNNVYFNAFRKRNRPPSSVTCKKSPNAYIDGKMWSVAENKNMFLKQNTTRLFSINSCAILIKPFVWAAQAGTF